MTNLQTNFPGWRVLAHIEVDPLPDDWRAQLAARLGHRPRRIGAWTELAIHGARLCLDAAQEDVLSPGAQLRVASLSGPKLATHAIAAQAHASVPMPFSFMQSQPSQMLAALGQQLGWVGDARFTVCRDRQVLLQLAQLEAGPAGVLIGWVEEDLRTEWWRLAPHP